VLDPATPAAPAYAGDNVRDNVEQVKVTGADTCAYTVEVRHKGTLLDNAAQDYSLIISVDAPPETGTLLIDEDFSGGLPAGWSVGTAGGVSWTINTPVPNDLRLDNNTGGGGQFAMVDNNYVVTETSLRTPIFDLSSSDAAVLRFSSYFFFDFFETIGVDVSTDGGATWTEAWMEVGVIHDPYRIVLDLSAYLAGQTSVMLQFRYDSNGQPEGNLWQIDDIELEVFEAAAQPQDLPGPAGSPSPTDGAAGLGLHTDIEWTAGPQTDSHAVYFGTANPLGASEFRGNQPGTVYDPGPLAVATTYYWRVDEVNAEGPLRGCTWSFTTQGEPPEIIHSSGFESGGN
jgi:hypothetical protein